jgi:hypothetical protein
MYSTIEIKGVVYELYSIERKDMGGRHSFEDIKEWLNEQGIKWNKSRAYSPFVGQYGLFIEKKHTKKVEKFLWG